MAYCWITVWLTDTPGAARLAKLPYCTIPTPTPPQSVGVSAKNRKGQELKTNVTDPDSAKMATNKASSSVMRPRPWWIPQNGGGVKLDFQKLIQKFGFKLAT